MELRLDSRQVDPWTVLDVAGEVDLFTAPALRERIVGLIGEGHLQLLVNLGEVGFMDSSGLGVLVAGLKRAREAGGEMALVCREGPTYKVLAITGLDRVFPIYDSVDDAVGS
ncbi:MAG TPA: STAS domain-containing protein [Actinomycetota bacterium]